ncbi:uncharacterized protein [Diadema antillarum]|uniref:uncharacterized protein n=1 Tax=Diadema antillarum TaxID=105358 RepID=UPI003A843753
MLLNTTTSSPDLSEAGKEDGLTWYGILGIVVLIFAIVTAIGGGSIYFCCKEQLCGWCQRLFGCPDGGQRSNTAQGHPTVYNCCLNFNCCNLGGHHTDGRNGVPISQGNVTYQQPGAQGSQQQNGGGNDNPSVFTCSEKERLARLLSQSLVDKDWTTYAEELGADQNDIQFHQNNSQVEGARWMLNRWEQQGRTRREFIEFSRSLEREDVVDILCPRRADMQSGENDPLLHEAGGSGEQVASTSQGSPTEIAHDGNIKL